MTYKELYDKALWDLEHDNMTLGEFERITEPLNKEIPKEEPADGDLISRKDTIEWLKKVTVTDGITFETGFKQILTDIEQMPSAEKNEMWIDEGFYAEGHSEHAYRCSECDEHYIGYVGEFKYCPNCGAKMQESEEE